MGGSRAVPSRTELPTGQQFVHQLEAWASQRRTTSHRHSSVDTDLRSDAFAAASGGPASGSQPMPYSKPLRCHVLPNKIIDSV